MSAVPIGLSFGDIIAAIKVLRNVARALSDHHGAAQAYQSTVEDVESIALTLEELCRLRLGPEHTAHVNALRGQTARVLRIVGKIESNLKTHHEQLGLKRPRGWYRAPLSKSKWALKTQQSIDGNRKELENHALSLKALVAALILKVNGSIEAKSNQMLALLQAKTEEDRQRFADVATALHAMTTAPPKLQGTTLMSPNPILAGKGGGTGTTTTLPSTPPAYLQATWKGPSTPQDWNEEEWFQVDWLTPYNNEPSARQPHALFVLALLTFLYDLVRYASIFAIVVVPFLDEIPRSVSLLLPDNLSLVDPLGRRFQLPVSFGKNWEVVAAMLKTHFHGTPGALKIERGQFRIFDVHDPERTIRPSDWTDVVGPRKRFKISIVMSRMQTINRMCVRCNSTLSPFGPSHATCKGCGLFCHSSVKFLSQIQLDKAASSRTLWRPHQLQILSGFWPQRAQLFELTIRSWLAGSLSGRPCSDSQEPSNKSSEKFPKAQSADTLDQQSNESSSDPVSTQDANPNPLEPEDEEVQEAQSWPETNAESRTEKALEEAEIKFFINVSMKRDESLHDAAAAGNYDVVCQLLDRGFDPNELGSTGSVLSAAILSGSLKIVQRLIRAGAEVLPSPDILLPPWHLPLPVAVRYSQNHVLTEYLLMEAVKAAAQSPRAFQTSLDVALFQLLSATLATRRTPRRHYTPSITVDRLRTLQPVPSMASTLLYLGANPMSTNTRADQRSAFLLAYLRRCEPYVETFLAAAHARGCFSASQILAVMQAFHGQPLDTGGTDESLQALYNNLLIDRTNVVERTVQKHLETPGPPCEFFQLAVVPETNLSLHYPYDGPRPSRRTWLRVKNTYRMDKGEGGCMREPTVPMLAINGVIIP
ncbi:hypothetical protein MFIFM68171_08131 [Madurella fahalii]|uniref:Ubiquitin-like domain-containing protein n=1 Tax=Madurella fahalii TaxID=1157608 RepID=A0ABQ0GJK5_9PEZI